MWPAWMGKTIPQHSVPYDGYLLQWPQKQSGMWYAKEARLPKKDNKKTPDTDPALGSGYNTDSKYLVSLLSKQFSTSKGFK